MLGNDNAGDCVIAGACHACMLQNELVGRVVKFSDASALRTYSEATGYNPADPSTNQGTDMAAFMDFWKNTGLINASGNRHKIAAYVRLNVANFNQVLEAMAIFKALSLGIQFPGSAMDQTNNNELWDVVPGAQIEGGPLHRSGEPIQLLQRRSHGASRRDAPLPFSRHTSTKDTSRSVKRCSMAPAWTRMRSASTSFKQT